MEAAACRFSVAFRPAPHYGRAAKAVGHIRTLRIKGEEADAIAERAGDHPTIGGEAELFDIASAHVGLLNVVRQPAKVDVDVDIQTTAPIISVVRQRRRVTAESSVARSQAKWVQ